MIKMKFTLLTHEKEQKRADNSGKLLQQITQINCETLLWQRTHPEPQLVEALSSGKAVLLCQQGDGQQLTSLDEIEHLVILDGTWQEARKIYNKSPYLKSARWFSLPNPPNSRYNLRRNQIAGGLCTAECAIEVLKLSNNPEISHSLEQLFENFLANDRSNQQG